MVSQSRCPLFTTPLPHVLSCAALIFFIAACAVPNWSNGNVQMVTASAFGDFEIGLWKSCSDITQSSSMPVALFSSLGDCRFGHCSQTDELASGSTWSANNLCDKSAAVQAFTILSIFACLLCLGLTSWRALAGRTILWGKGTFLSLASTLFSLISWATWLDWHRGMNSDRPTAENLSIKFSELELGPGMTLSILGFLCCFINIFLMYSRFVAQSKAEADLKKRRHDTTSSYAGGIATNDTIDLRSADNPTYLEVGDETAAKPKGSHVPKIPVPGRPGSVGSGWQGTLNPVDNKQTAL